MPKKSVTRANCRNPRRDSDSSHLKREGSREICEFSYFLDAINRRLYGRRPISMNSQPARRRRKDFVEHTLAGLLGAFDQSLQAEELAAQRGLLQSLDPRVNLVGLMALILAATMSHSLAVICALFVCAVVLALLSRVPLRTLAAREWLPVFIFTGFVAFPAIFLTPGPAISRLPLLNWEITATGTRSALYLISRVETAATLALLMVLCTPWPQVLKALRCLGVPVVVVVMLGMTHRYIFLLLQSALDLFQARRSRIVAPLDGAARRRLATTSAGVLLGKSLHLSHEVFLAMQARGFRGEVYTLDEFQMRPRDWLALAAFLALTGLALWFGRR